MHEYYLYNGDQVGLSNSTFWPKGDTWYRVRKGPSDHEYELLASTFWSSESISKHCHLLMVQKCFLAHSINTTCGVKWLRCPLKS